MNSSKRPTVLSQIIAETESMKKLLLEVDTLAPTDATVLIIGETGVGKDVIATAIHRLSNRCNQPFVRMNCAELNEGVIESELFGHERGSFTGASTRKRGKLEIAHKGTLFLDEVGDIPLGTQKKLLRVLEQKEFERVGGTETIRIDVRVIAATNRILARSVKRKEFRKDLFYRLNTLLLELPPLRDRKEDIIPLAKYFLHQFSNGGKQVKLTNRVRNMLLSYRWPGNVRELKSTMERVMIFSKNGDIDTEKLFRENDFIEEVEAIFTIASPSLILEDVEKSLLLKVLENTKWNIQHSARILQISRTTLYEKMKKYELGLYMNGESTAYAQKVPGVP
jgi:transcriptional regulator with PAS, ATPase and Fis domain